MMSPRRLSMVVILAVVMRQLVPVLAQAQLAAPASELTIEELVARALADNPDLRATRAEVDAAGGRLRQAGLRPNPELDLGGQKALSPDNNLTVTLRVPLDLNDRRGGRVAVAEQDLELRRKQLADRERRLRTDVRMKAGEMLAARRNLQITDELLDVNRSALGVVGNRVREGAAPTIDENLQLVEVNRLDANRQLLSSRVEIATLQLKLLAGMAADAPLTVRGELATAPPTLERAEAVQRALASRPDLAAARADVAVARAMIRKEQAEGRWDASVNVGYMRQDFGFGGLNGLTNSGQTRPIQDTFHYFGGGVTIMLPVLNRNQGNIAAAEAGVRAAERRLEFAMLTTQQEVEAAFAQHEAARRSLEIYERGVRDVARRNLAVVRQSYELGRGSLLDVIAEQRRFIDVETGYTDVLKQVYDAAVEVERAVGVSEH
jgi:cobalt-zinc-cadmium efflux system outer membrane protein